MSYKGASQTAQHRLTRAVPRRYGSFEGEVMTDDEYRVFLKEKIAQLELKLFLIKDKDNPERKQIAYQKHVLSKEMFVLNGSVRKMDNSALANKFMDVIRRNIPKEDFDFYLTAATKELEHDKQIRDGKA